MYSRVHFSISFDKNQFDVLFSKKHIFKFEVITNQTVKPIFLRYSRYQNIKIEDEEGKWLLTL